MEERAEDPGSETQSEAMNEDTHPQGQPNSQRQADQAPVEIEVQTAADSEGPRAKAARGAYYAREKYLLDLEQEGELSFQYVENDGTQQNMIWLIGLKNIYSKQLPNMPKEYICRLVLDKRHRSVALVKRSGALMGGITYRAFHDLGFGEIAFCAVTSSEQVKGFGTRLMNYTKEFAVSRDKLTHFLTYADNNAVGYFLKQGFTKEVSLPRERWHGWIKDYDGGTLMECVMQPRIHYAFFPAMIEAQQAAVDARVRERAHGPDVVYPGLTHFPAATAKPQSQIPLSLESIPGVVEAGWSHEQYGDQLRYRIVSKEGLLPVTAENLQPFLMRLWQEVNRCDESHPFRFPVDKAQVADYYDIIKDPMDLSTIQARLKAGGYYHSLEMFVADFKRIFANCRFYNAPETIYCKFASKLEQVMESWLSHWLNFNRS